MKNLSILLIAIAVSMTSCNIGTQRRNHMENGALKLVTIKAT